MITSNHPMRATSALIKKISITPWKMSPRSRSNTYSVINKCNMITMKPMKWMLSAAEKEITQMMP